MTAGRFDGISQAICESTISTIGIRDADFDRGVMTPRAGRKYAEWYAKDSFRFDSILRRNVWRMSEIRADLNIIDITHLADR